MPPAIEEVVVVAPRLPDSLGNAAFSIVPLDEQEIDVKRRVDESLMQVPGVSLFRRSSSLTANATTQGMSLRAIAPSGASRALVTLDGVPLNDPFGGWVIWSQLQPEIMGGANIVRGAGSGPYGSGALTGTVALSSKEAATPFEADASFGDLGTWTAGGRVDMAIGNVGLRVAGAGQHFDGFVPVHSPDRGHADIRADFGSYTTSTRLSVKHGDVSVIADLGHFHEARGSGLYGADSSSDGTTGSLTVLRQPDPTQSGYRFSVWGKRSDLYNSSVSTTSDRNGDTPANTQYATPALGFGFNAALRGVKGGGQRETSWEFGVDGRYADGESREYYSYSGTQFTRQRVSGGQQTTIGAYAEGSAKRGGWLFTGGLRADRWADDDAKRIESLISTGAVTLNRTSPDRSGIAVTGRLAARRDFKEGAFLRAAAYSGFRPPTLNELHRPFRVGNDSTEANPSLDPEKLYGIEIGAGLERHDTRLSATLFYNRVVDPITNVTLSISPSGTQRQRQNVGHIDAYGLEVEAQQTLSAQWTLRGALSLTHARVDGGDAAPQLTGLRPAQAPVVSATAGVLYQPIQRLVLSADARFESARFDDDLNTRRLSAGVTANGRLDLELTEWVSIYVSAENVFDQKIETAETADGVESYAAPRIVRFGVHIK